MDTAQSKQWDRWEKAQKYERKWWADRVEAVDPLFYRTYAKVLQEDIAPYLSISDDTHILEIGSGAAGIITFLDSEHKFAVDPLESFYSTVEEFTEARDPRVQYTSGPGEDLPYEGASFDLIICDNVLDHCAYPKRVLQEMRRVLRPSGIVYLRIHVYHQWGLLMRSAAEMLQIDAGHPYTFTDRRLRRLIDASGLVTVDVEDSGYLHTWARELLSGTAKNLLKALTFATRNKTRYLLRESR